MIADQALKLAGVPFRNGGWYPEKPPSGTFATILDEVETWGTGTKNLAQSHSVTIELYTATADSDDIGKVDSALDRFGIEHTKYEPLYIKTEKFYMTLFTFEFIRKGTD